MIQCSNSKEAGLRAREALQTMLREKKRSGVPMLLLLSGGSAFSLLDAIHKDACGTHIVIGMLDERFSVDEDINNFAQFVKTAFYANAKTSGAAFIDTRGKGGETQDELTTRFLCSLQNWVTAHRDGVVVATMGMGADGHTAGIMPFPEDPELFRQLFEDEKRWVTAYDAGNKNPYPLRVTVTLPFLREQVAHTIVFVVGEEKKDAMRRVLAEEGLLSETPARIIHEMKNVQVFSDVLL